MSYARFGNHLCLDCLAKYKFVWHGSRRSRHFLFCFDRLQHRRNDSTEWMEVGCGGGFDVVAWIAVHIALLDQSRASQQTLEDQTQAPRGSPWNQRFDKASQHDRQEPIVIPRHPPTWNLLQRQLAGPPSHNYTSGSTHSPWARYLDIANQDSLDRQPDRKKKVHD